MSSTPSQLVAMLYRGAIEAVVEARRGLARRQTFERGRAVSKAIAILGELAGSLDRQSGGEFAIRLANLYEYINRLLVQGNFEQQDAPLAEAEGLLRTLAEGWQAVAAEGRDHYDICGALEDVA